MNTNNTLLTLSTIALVFTGSADAANSELLHDSPAAVVQIKQRDAQVSITTGDVRCNPGEARPECRPNDDCVCIAA